MGWWGFAKREQYLALIEPQAGVVVDLAACCFTWSIMEWMAGWMGGVFLIFCMVSLMYFRILVCLSDGVQDIARIFITRTSTFVVCATTMSLVLLFLFPPPKNIPVRPYLGVGAPRT